MDTLDMTQQEIEYVRFIDEDLTTYGQSDIGLNKHLTLDIAEKIEHPSINGITTDVKLMSLTFALSSVDQIISQCLEHDEVTIEFVGNDPLLNRQLIRQVTEYSKKQAAPKNIWINFAICTNANLLTSNDARFFQQHKYNVTVRFDGPKTINSKRNTTTQEKAQYYNSLRGIGFLRSHMPNKLDAQVTVTPHSPGLLPLLQHMMSLGFESVEFIPVLVSTDPDYEFNAKEFDRFLIEMSECGAYARNHLPSGKKFSFRDFDAVPNKRLALAKAEKSQF